MATRSTIMVTCCENVHMIYCHWDGYVCGGVGETLLKHYNTQQTATLVVSLGDLSSLGSTMDVGDTTAYGRDRNELGTETSVFTCYHDARKSHREEFNYFWDGSKWLVNGLDLQEVYNKEVID